MITLYLGEGADLLSTVQSDLSHLERIRREGGYIVDRVVRKRPLDSILVQSGVSHLDFMSIDVEGHELHVLEGFTFAKWAPRVVLIEDNSNLVDPTVERHMRQQGYVRFYRTGCNDWYANRADKELAGIFQLLRSNLFVSWKTVLRLRLRDRVGAVPEKIWRLVRRGLSALGSVFQKHPACRS